MIRVLSFLCLLYLPLNAYSQPGCTDPGASNYDPGAAINDGSCIYPYTHVSPLKICNVDTGVHESSGLVYFDGRLWTHNDSGNPSDICNIDTASGVILQTLRVDNFLNTDWEDISSDSAFIYLADFGNNNGDRHDLKILKIRKSDIDTGRLVHVNAEAINYSYTDQTSFTANPLNNYDCEAIISVDDSLYLFTKNRGDYKTRVYRVSKTPGTYSIPPLNSFDVGGLITGASYDPQSKELALIGYSLLATNSFVLLLNDYQGKQFFSGNKRRIDISNGAAWQTEAIVWMPGSRLFISCEASTGSAAALYQMSRILPASTAVSGNSQAPYLLYPIPAQEYLQLSVTAATGYKIISMDGRLVRSGQLDAGNNRLRISHLPSGSYMMLLGIVKPQHFVKQ